MCFAARRALLCGQLCLVWGLVDAARRTDGRAAGGGSLGVRRDAALRAPARVAAGDSPQCYTGGVFQSCGAVGPFPSHARVESSLGGGGGPARTPPKNFASVFTQLGPTGLASRFDNGNPHGFSGFVEANFGRFGSLRVLAAGAFCVYRLKSLFEAALRKKRRQPPNIDKNRCIPSRLPRYARLGRPGG